MSRGSSLFRLSMLACLLLPAAIAAVGSARAAGPLLVNGSGVPLVWQTPSVSYNPDRGTLGLLSNAEALSRLSTAGSTWSMVTTSGVSFVAGAQLPIDVTVSSYDNYLFICGDGLSPVIFDTDGRITEELYGDGASDHVLGFAAPACGDFDPPAILEGLAVMNGRFLDGTDNASNPEISADEFQTVLIHELGHFLGLDHSQVGLQQAIDGVDGDAIATMFPFLETLSQATLHLDDEVSVSSLYPEASFESGHGTIAGRVYLADGITPFQGANVVARSVTSSLTVVSQVSGAFFFPGNAGGPAVPGLTGYYELRGLPAGEYTVEIEPVYPAFVGGSSVGPLEVPAGMPGMPEFWNGIDEAGSNPPDDPVVAEEVVVAAGMTMSGIDFVLNQGPPPSNDDCVAASVVAAFPFSEAIDVTGAVRGAFDPIQSCTGFAGEQNHSSVWYRIDAPTDGVLHVSTDGSNYDTVVTTGTGACGSVAESACDDDSGVGATSDLATVVEAGASYLVEVTSASTGGGLLEIEMDVLPSASCPVSLPAGCVTPSEVNPSSLRVRPGDMPDETQLQWKWGSGSVALADLGQPLVATGTSYAFCLYDGPGVLRMEALAPAGDRCGTGSAPCWIARGGRLSYKDRSGLPDGLSAIKIRSSDVGRAKLSLKGGAANLDVPTLPLDVPVIALLLNSEGNCWRSDFPASAIGRNDEVELKARGQ